MCELPTGFEEPPAFDDEEPYSPDFDESFRNDIDGINSVASNEQESDLSDLEDFKMPASATKTTGAAKKTATAKSASASSNNIIQSGENMTYVIPYGDGFDQRALVLAAIRTPNPEISLAASGGILQLNEQVPDLFFNKNLTTKRELTAKAHELKVSTDALVAAHCKMITKEKPDPQKPKSESTLIALPFPCQPITDRSAYVERRNGLYVFQIDGCNIMMVFLKDKSAPYQKEKKKKTKATKIDVSFNDESDDSDDDSDYDPDNDAVLLSELTELFGGDEVRAREAAAGLASGGNVKKHWKSLIRGLRGLEDAARNMNIDDDDDEVDDDLDV